MHPGNLRCTHKEVNMKRYCCSSFQINSIFPNPMFHLFRIWPLDLWDPFYEANVLNVDNDSHGSHIIVQIGDHTITKATFSKSLKPDGWMSSFVLDAQCEIWRSQWPDKIILTTFASVSSNFAYHTCNFYIIHVHHLMNFIERIAVVKQTDKIPGQGAYGR